MVFRILSVLIYSSIFFFLSDLPFLSAFPFRCFIFLPIKLSRIAKYAEFLTLTVCQIFLNCSCYFHLNTNGPKPNVTLGLTSERYLLLYHMHWILINKAFSYFYCLNHDWNFKKNLFEATVDMMVFSQCWRSFE